MIHASRSVRYTHSIVRSAGEGRPGILLERGMTGRVVRAEARGRAGFLVRFRAGTLWVRAERLVPA